jgi:RNA polymerase sigma factor (sigma-70 family)
MDAKLQQLLQQVTAGSEDAARQLFEQYGRFLLYLIRQRMHRRLRSRLDSIDIAQDVWASFFAEPLEKRVFPTTEHFLAYLARLAHSKVTDQVRHDLAMQKRSAKRETSMDDSRCFDKDALPGPTATPSHIVMARDEWTDFLSKQPLVCQKIFLLMRDGKTNQEIAVELGINDRFIRRVVERAAAEVGI